MHCLALTWRESVESEEATSVPTLPAYMYALTREKRLPPMAGIRKSVYGLLKPQKRRGDRCNILGYFSHLHDSCELYGLLKSVGVSTQELSRCDTIERYHELSSANFNLVINPEARYAAQDMEKRLGIPFIEINRFYRIDKIHNQYRLLGQALGVQFEDGKFYDAAKKSAENLAAKHGTVRFAVGECVNADSFELALALTEYGHKVSEIYGTVGERNFFYIKKLAELSPDTRIFTNLSPTMLNYERKTEIDVTIGVDATITPTCLMCRSMMKNSLSVMRACHFWQNSFQKHLKRRVSDEKTAEIHFSPCPR